MHFHFHGSPQFVGPGKNLVAVIPKQKRFRNCTTVSNSVCLSLCVCVQGESERTGWRDEGSMCENWVQLFHGQVFLDTKGVKSPSHSKKDSLENQH